MNMNAYPLSSFSGTKNSDHWHSGPIVFFRHAISKGQWRVQLRRASLVMVNAVEKHAKGFHRIDVGGPKASPTSRKYIGEVYAMKGVIWTAVKSLLSSGTLDS